MIVFSFYFDNIIIDIMLLQFIRLRAFLASKKWDIIHLPNGLVHYFKLMSGLDYVNEVSLKYLLAEK